MSVLMRAGELAGRPVVTLDTAEDVAEIKDVVFSHAEAAVVGFTLNGRGWLSGPLKAVLPWSRVAALGRDAVMISGREALGGSDEAMAAARTPGNRDVVGTSVLTDAGKSLGRVTDLILEVDARAAVVGFEIAESDRERRFIPVADTVAVSGDALIVPATVEEFVRDDLSGFGSAVAGFRERLAGERR